MIGDGDDIQRLRAEIEAARAELREWKQLADSSSDVISRIDAKGRITYVSPAVRKILGYEPEELVGQVGFEFIDPEQQSARRAGFAEGLKQGKAPTVVSRVRRKDGAYLWMEYRTEVLRNERGEVTGFQSISHDVTARHEAELAFRESEGNFETFVRTMPVPAVIHRDTKVVLANRAFTEFLGYSEEELCDRSVFDIVENADHAYIEQRLKTSPQERAGVRTREHQLVHKDGTRIPIEVTVVPVSFRGALCPMGIVHDLRERKRLEAQLITADRMASLGRLAAAVGHEINNPLAYVLGSLGLIERELAQSGLAPERAHQVRELLANVQEGAERIRTVVQDLRVLSRERSDAGTPVDLGHVLDLCISMADHEVRHRARLVKVYDDLPAVVGTEARLGQVFLNLLLNAAQAIPEGARADHEVRVEGHPSSDGRVAIDVVDTGVGIDPDLVERVFEPFFTTKPGEGTGLGLPISQHIVTSLGGTIAIMPNTPRGTRIRVVLPCAEGEVASATAAPTEAPADEPAVRVLVVDDEPQLAQMIARLLRPRAVDVALGGKEALDRIRGDARYDVILCDLHMNDLSGMDVFEQIQRSFPGLERRMIFMTGGVVSARAVDFVANSGCPILDKPFDARTLESTIATLLNGA